MSRKIDPQRIADRDLDDDEVAYLRDRGRLPADYFDDVEEEEVQETPTIETHGGIEEEEEGYEADYDEGWNNNQRRKELTNRGLSIEGKKEELISRLRRSDSDQLETEDYVTIDD